MSQGWQAPFRVLRDQFLSAAGENFRVDLALASFPDHGARQIWYDRTIQADLLRDVTSPMNCEPGQPTRGCAIGTVWGEAEGVRRFDALAREGGNSLPFDFYPPARLFPWYTEPANLDPGPATLWSEFLFVARQGAFRTREGWPVPGCRVARLDGDPFLASATAIERFMLAPDAPALGEYFRLMRAVCPWLTNTAGGFPMTPLGILASPDLRVNLPAVFRAAVELGEALAAGDRLRAPTPPGAAGVADQFAAAIEAQRTVDVATERLLCLVNPRLSRVPEWSRQLDYADATANARQAVRTLGLAVADIRGDGDWEERGRALLSDGAWHLWAGMRAHERAEVRGLLAETHRLWGWPADPDGEPGGYTGPRATLADPRVIDQNRWRTTRPEYLEQLQAVVCHHNLLVDTIRLPAGRYFDIRRDDVRSTRYSIPSVCPHADSRPPTELRPDGELLAEVELRFRELGLVGPDESVHWVGRQERGETRCGCELAPAELFRDRPPEWRTLRDLKSAVVSVLKLVGTHVEARRPETAFPAQDLAVYDTLAERVYGLAQALNIPLPPVSAATNAPRIDPHGHLGLPVLRSPEGVTIPEAASRWWLSNWRAVRVGIDARLEQLDRAARPDAGEGIDTRDHSLAAPAGTPSPLREAFESVAAVLFEAAGLRREPWGGVVGLRELGGTFASHLQAADRCYAGAELQLQAAADAHGCAHQEALAATRRVNDAIGHVILGAVPGHMAVAYLRHVPAPDVAGLLRRMRQQVSRAAHAVRITSHSGAVPAGATVSPGIVADGPGENLRPETASIRREGPQAAGENRTAGLPPIDETELAILTELRARQPVLVMNVDLEEATRLSKQKVGEVVTGLIAKNLVTRPKGKRKGATLTPEGVALVNHIRKSSADHP